MVKAVICLPPNQRRLRTEIISFIDSNDIYFFNSTEDVFDYLWTNGSDIDVLVVHLKNGNANELYSSAIHWPEMRVIALPEEGCSLPERPMNIIVVPGEDTSYSAKVLRAALTSVRTQPISTTTSEPESSATAA